MRKIKNIDLEKYAYVESDPWRWAPAAGTDCQDITDMALVDFGKESEQIFQNDPMEYQRNIMRATVNQFYNPKMELISVARSVYNNSLLGYTWAVRGEYAPWSREEMAMVRIAHIDQQLGERTRVKLCAQMLRMWEVWADACDIKIICSSTIRNDQTAFLRLHEEAGYLVRGSVCYKRLNVQTYAVEQDRPSSIIIPS